MNKQSIHHLICRVVSFTVVYVVGLILLPLPAMAIPLANYHDNLQRAITALDTLTQTDEEESLTDYQRRLAQTITAIREALPEGQTVQSGEEFCNIDNSWLYKELDELGNSVESKRPEKIAQIIERLKAIEQRVAEAQEPGRLALSKGEASGKLRDILGRAEYATKARDASVITRLLQDLVRWVQSFFPKRAPIAPGRANVFVTIAQIVIVSLAVAVILYVLLKVGLPLLKRSRRQKTKKEKQPRIVLGEVLEPEESATDLLSEAEALARAGELRAAIRKAYIALLVELGDRKLISLAQYKTNRDYLRAVSNIPLLYSRMSGLTDSFERHWYGFAHATQADWQDFRADYHAALQTRN